MESFTASHDATAASRGIRPAGQKITAPISGERSGPIDSMTIHFNRAVPPPSRCRTAQQLTRELIQIIFQMPGFGPHTQFLLGALLNLSDPFP